MAELDVICADQKLLNDNIAHCLRLEEKFGPQLPLHILTAVSRHFPANEDVAYLVVKFAGYSFVSVRQYLISFAKQKSKPAFAETFLEKTLTFKNMGLVDLFEEFIRNKLDGRTRTRWAEKLAEMRAEYKPSGIENRAVGLMYAFYTVFAVLNLGLTALFIFIKWDFLLSIVVGVGALFVQAFILYLHNKKYGARMELSERERLFMVVLMCTMVILAGGAFCGALI